LKEGEGLFGRNIESMTDYMQEKIKVARSA
jgi:hypothetical protein